MSEGSVHLSLRRDEALLLCEMLADLQDQSCVEVASPAGGLALVRLQGALEPDLVEPFIPEYHPLLEKACAHLTDQFVGESIPG